jgi:Tol biopolymer transport system component
VRSHDFYPHGRRVVACRLDAIHSTGKPDRASAEAVHHRAVSQHDVNHRRLVFRRRVSHPLLSNKTGIWNAYTVPVGGGTWTPLTSSTTDSTYGVSFFPTDDRILITRDQGGNELNHLYARTPSGEERDLTPGDKLKAIFMQFSPDGSAFYVQTNERDAKAFDIYRYDSKTYARTMLFENKDGYFPSDVSDDGKWVSLDKVLTTNDSDVYVWSAASKQTIRVSPHQEQANFSAFGFVGAFLLRDE